jgi:hypothetical protein
VTEGGDPSLKTKKEDPRETWEPMKASDVGHVGEVLQGGGGKLSPTAEDTGDIRKPKGQA